MNSWINVLKLNIIRMLLLIPDWEQSLAIQDDPGLDIVDILGLDPASMSSYSGLFIVNCHAKVVSYNDTQSDVELQDEPRPKAHFLKGLMTRSKAEDNRKRQSNMLCKNDSPTLDNDSLLLYAKTSPYELRRCSKLKCVIGCSKLVQAIQKLCAITRFKGALIVLEWKSK